jgi:hypothetical protein
LPDLCVPCLAARELWNGHGAAGSGFFSPCSIFSNVNRWGERMAVIAP